MVQVMSMDGCSSPPSPNKQKNNTHLRNMVRSFVSNLEEFQQEVSLVVNDMKDLVSQIDSVTERISNKFTSSQENSEKSLQPAPRNRSPTKSPEKPKIHHDYVNVELIPKIRNIENKINLKLTAKSTKDEQNVDEEVANDERVKPNRPKSDDLTELEIFSFGAKQNKIENNLDSFESPMLDLSYLGMTSTDSRPCWGRSISLPLAETTEFPLTNRIPELGSYNGIQSRDFSLPEMSFTPTAVCYAELKRHYPISRRISSSDDEVFYDLQASSRNTGTTVKTPGESPTISNISIDGDLYERHLDTELENIPETSDLSSNNDSSDISMDTGSNAFTDSFSDNADGRYEVNTWTSFTFSNSTRSSESFVSDTPSDIMNDNVLPPMNNLFSTSMLARKLSKHLDNDDFVSINENTHL